MSDDRPDWDTYFLDIAVAVAKRADCTRRQVGAVLVKDKRIIGSGYNGAPKGDPGCLEGFCPRGQLSYEELQGYTDYENGPGRCISIHAEVNAILYSSLDERSGAVLYVTCKPCNPCMKVIRGSGVARAHWPEQTPHGDNSVDNDWRSLGHQAGWDRKTDIFYTA